MKRRFVFLLAIIMLFGLMLTGCDRDREDGGDGNTPTETTQPAPPRTPDGQPDNPNRPPPERNPDGTLG